MNHQTSSPAQPISDRPAAPINVRTLPDGTRLQLRPVRPQDEAAIANLMARVSAAGRRNRFHGTVNLSATQLHAMVCVDHAKEIAFVVTVQKIGDVRGAEQIIAEARFCIDADANADADGAEFALVVDDHWQRLGLGRWVMHALRDAAQAVGLTWLHGEILSSNLPMLALMRDCGLCCTPDREDDGLVQAQLRLGGPHDAPTAMPTRTRTPTPKPMSMAARRLKQSLTALSARLGLWVWRSPPPSASIHHSGSEA